MRDKQIACVLLLLVIAAFGWVTHSSYEKLVKEQKAVMDAKKVAVKVEGDAARARTELDRLKDSTKALRGFATEWSPYVEEVRSPQATEQKVIDLIKEAGVFALSQRFELLEQRKEATIKRRLRAHITIEDHYAKALNWMADLESAIPVCRVASCRLKRGASGNDVRLELILDIPVISEKLAG